MYLRMVEGSWVGVVMRVERAWDRVVQLFFLFLVKSGSIVYFELISRSRLLDSI